MISRTSVVPGHDSLVWASRGRRCGDLDRAADAAVPVVATPLVCRTGSALVVTEHRPGIWGALPDWGSALLHACGRHRRMVFL